MASNPLTSQGSLNRVKASVTWVDFPELNVTAPFLGREGLSLSFEGNAVAFLPTMIGAITSPEAYLMVGLTLHLLKPQSLCNLYKLRWEDLALLGNGTVRPDVTTGLEPFDIVNCGIENIRELAFNGSAEGFALMIRGYYIVNNALWQ